MKSKIKKTLIIISSAIVLFLGVFFMTRSLNNLIEGSEKENIISIEDNSSQTASDESDNQNNQSSQNQNTKVNENTAKNTQETDKTQTTNSLPAEKYTDYIVKEGDTLFSIARNTMPWKSQDEAVKILETMNSLKSREVISVGSRLMVPVNTMDTTGYTKYIVKAGESLYTIAEDYLPDMNPAKAVDMIMKKNSITDPTLLSVGLEIYIPDDESSLVNSDSADDVNDIKTSVTDEDDSAETSNDEIDTELSAEDKDNE